MDHKSTDCVVHRISEADGQDETSGVQRQSSHSASQRVRCPSTCWSQTSGGPYAGWLASRDGGSISCLFARDALKADQEAAAQCVLSVCCRTMTESDPRANGQLASKRTVERMAAVQRALDPERARTETDILIESILIALEQESCTKSELWDRVCALWPGAQISERSFERSLTVALRNGLVAQVVTDEGRMLGLVANATEANYKSAAQRVLERSADQVREYFRDEYDRDLTSSETRRLLDVLIDMLGAGIRDAFAPYEGAVKQVANDALMPDHYDTDAMRSVLDGAPIADQLKPGVMALCLASIDVSSDTGTELVTQLATGYVLHAFIARQDQQEDLKAVGTLDREWLLLDTPVLFTLLSRLKASRALGDTIALAKSAGMRVILPEACVAEYRQLIDSASDIAVGVTSVLSEGTSPRALYGLYDHIAIECWLTYVITAGRLSWSEFRRKADELPHTLGADGGTVMQYRMSDYSDRRLLEDCNKSIRAELEELKRHRGESFKTKSAPAIDVDAKSMATAIRQRRGRRKTERFWPGAWILTPDKRLSPAYKRIDSADEFPLTLSSPQLAVLLSTFVPTASKQSLAQSAAELLSHDTLIQVASRYPPEVATQIARVLSDASSNHDIDVRLAQQLSFEQLVDSGGGRDPDADKKAASALLAARVKRRDRIAALEIDRARSEAVRAESSLSEASAYAAAMEKQVENERQAARKEAEDLKSDLKRQSEEKREVELRLVTFRRRVAVMSIAVVLALGGVASAASTSFPWFGVGTFITGLLLGLIGWGWAAEHSKPWTNLLSAIAGEIVGVIDLIGR